MNGVETLEVLRVPVCRDHVDGLGVQHRLGVGGGEGGRGSVTDPQPGGVAAVVVGVQGARVSNQGVGVKAGQGAG